MRLVILLITLTSMSVGAKEWSPPQEANPQAILQEAWADTRAKRFETALAKHVWFHENALSIRPSLYGVRLSFALGYWSELAEQYPPALTKLQEIRDNAHKKVMDGNDVRESFHDMEAINAHLNQQSATMKVFIYLDENSPDIANQVFDVAQPSLIQAKAFSLIGKYISPMADFAKMKESYRQGKELADDVRFGARHLDFANKKFANDSTTLIAILTLNNHKQEAEDIAASARVEWDDKSFHTALEQALNGVVPDPWP